jgi:uncharacterized protein YndB with AHSA1/START domain
MKVGIAGDAIVSEIEIAAPPDAVLEALVDPRQLGQWWGSEDSYRTSNWKIDLRIGGT